MTLQAPVTYQGGKTRLASEIVRWMGVPRDAPFFDLCCGSGAVSLALIEAGHDSHQVQMVDLSPWGLFWQAVGDGSFDIDRFRAVCDAVPKDPRDVKAHVERLYTSPVGEDEVYIYLILQATAIGGKSISIEGRKWVRGSGFRDYWLPTETSSRRSPVNPMMPMPETIFERVLEIVGRCRGLRGLCADANAVSPPPGSVVYIDPQYEGTTGYGYSVDVVGLASRLASRGCRVWVSEGRALTCNAVCLSRGRAKGGITGDRKVSANEEWLSLFTEVGK